MSRSGLPVAAHLDLGKPRRLLLAMRSYWGARITGYVLRRRSGREVVPTLSVGLHVVDAPDDLAIVDHVVVVRAGAVRARGSWRDLVLARQMSALLGLGVTYRGVDFREKLRRVILLRKDVPPRRHERFEHLIEGFGLVLCHHGPSES